MADQDEFERLAMPHLEAVYRAAIALCGQPADADDLVQLTYLKALDKFRTLRPGTNCKAWLMRILRNTWIDELRHRKVVGTQVSIDETALPGRPDPSGPPRTGLRDFLEHVGDAELIRALNGLPEAQRMALFLIDVEQLTYDEAAEILDVAAGTVKSRCGRAREELRRRLHAHATDLGLTGQRRWTT